ncbi:MAG: Spy/CpxP family protein refolding chaperone [Acidobacteriota bacterium]
MQSAAPSSRIGRHSLALGGLVAATALSVILSLNAWAGEEPIDGNPPPFAGAMHGGPMMPMAGKGLDRMLSRLEATPTQKEQIRKIAEAAAPELKTLRDQAQALHEQGLKLWAAPKLDPQAAEQLRQKMLAQHNQMSQRMLKLMLDVGQVLTPEQRAKMAQHMQEHHRRGMHADEAPAPARREN